MTRIGIVEPRFADDNPLRETAKAYALTENQYGVPFGELKTLLGDKTTLNLATGNAVAGFHQGTTGGDTPFRAFQPLTNGITAALLEVADILRIDISLVIVNTGPPVTRATHTIFRFETFADDWKELTPAAVGDELIGASTGLRITSLNHRQPGQSGSYNPVELMFGRTATNEILVQHTQSGSALNPAAHWAHQEINIGVEFDSYTGGLLGRRIAQLRQFTPTHRLSIKTRAASRPALPTAASGFTYDGLTLAIPSDSPWTLASAADPSGSGDLWYAATTADYDQSFHQWTIDHDEWLLASTAATTEIPTPSFQVQFAEAETGPYHATRTGDDLWVRLRLNDGSWSAFPFNHEHHYVDRVWQMLNSRYLSGPPSGGWGRWETSPIDLANYRLVYFTFTHSDGYMGITPAINANEINVYGRLDSGWVNLRGNLVLGFPDDRSSWIRKDQNALGDGFRLILRFEQSTADGATPRQVGSIAYSHYQTNTRGLLTMWGL